MMKKYVISFLLVLTIVSNCMILNPLGLTLNREKGSDAKDRITTAAITADVVNTTILSSIISRGQSTFTGVFILSLIAGDLSSIDNDKYYMKSDVDDCVNDIENIVFWLVLAPLTPLVSCRNIKEADGLILGNPFPKI
jgi:small lipoprotein (TIGR04452 family)